MPVTSNAYWVTPQGEVIDVEVKHVEVVVREPEKFGFTTQFVRDAFHIHHEPVGCDGEAAFKLTEALLRKGFLRVRKLRNNTLVLASGVNSLTSTKRNALPRNEELSFQTLNDGAWKEFNK